MMAPRGLIAAALFTGSAAFAQPEPAPELPAATESAQRILIDRTLAQRPVRLVSISAESVEVTDAVGHVLSLSRQQVLALVPPLAELEQPVMDDRALSLQLPVAERSRIYGRLDLIDGQTFPGTLSAAMPTGEGDKPADKADQVAWNSKLFGRVSLPLDSVKTVVLLPDRADLRSAANVKDDSVLLVNGDRADGFVAGIGATIRIEKGGRANELPITRVASVQLANAVKPSEGVWVWLYDGTAVAASQLAVDSSGHTAVVGRLAGLAKQPTASLDANDLRAVCFDAGSLRALSSAPYTVTDSKQGTMPRRWIPPLKIADTHGSPLGAADIEIPGPMSVEWTLPAGSARLGTTVELPPSARVWGDCELIIEGVAGSKASQLSKVHLSGSTPSADVSVPLAGAGRLRMTIDPGPSGPIQDRVVLRRPVVLVDAKH